MSAQEPDWRIKGFPPRETAEAVAVRLREEILFCETHLAELEQMKERRSARFREEAQQAQGIAKARITDEWKLANDEYREEKKIWEAKRSQVRMLLQWLTAELWT